MRISIAMCTYNGAQYLQQQLDSFASQTCPPFELVVCDDGSTDATLALIERFSKRVNFSVRISKNECNLGSTKNFEKAIAICQGDLIALSDQDDEWYPDKLAEFHRLFEKFPEALAALGDADLIDENSALLQRNLWNSVCFSPAKRTPYVDSGISSVLFRQSIATGATMVFRAQLRNEFISIPDSWVHDGWIAWLAAFQSGLAVLPAAQMRYRIHPRQQLGLNPPSIAARIAIARRNELAPYGSLVNQVHQFQDLRQYLEEHRRDSQLAKFIPEVDAKLRHIQGRVALTKSPLHRRIRWILASWREYRRYALGPMSMLKDIYLVSRAPDGG